MNHLLPVLAKVAERIILANIVKELDLEETQFGSRKNRGVHDNFKSLLEFAQYNKERKVAFLSLDVEGRFDRIEIDLVYQVLHYRNCSGNLIKWVRR